MTLRVSLHDTRRALARPAQNARQSWAERGACIVTLEGDGGARGFGEASPLPGFSPDSLEDCVQALAAFDTSGVPTRLGAGQSALDELAAASRRLPSNVPAARAALECALLDLWSRVAGLPAWALLLAAGAHKPEPRPLAALLMGEPEQALEQARQAFARGLRSFKFNIGRPGALERELLALRTLRTELGPEARLRLDANRSFVLEEARACLPRFASVGLEFVEEPCALPQLSKLGDLGVSFALDESLSQLALGATEVSELKALHLQALVLKPTLLGGISGCATWARIAAQMGAEVVLSHAFEGPLGLALSAALALSLGSERMAHGLDLSGARLEQFEVPGFVGAQIEPWSEPGFGLEGLGE